MSNGIVTSNNFDCHRSRCEFVCFLSCSFEDRMVTLPPYTKFALILANQFLGRQIVNGIINKGKGIIMHSESKARQCTLIYTGHGAETIDASGYKMISFLWLRVISLLGRTNECRSMRPSWITTPSPNMKHTCDCWKISVMEKLKWVSKRIICEFVNKKKVK